MKNVMTIAWEIAKKGAAKFGGSVKSYFAAALKMAWATIKGEGNSVKVSKWSNANGVEIEMHTEHVTKDSLGKDDYGTEFFKKVDKIDITKLLIGGEEVNTWNTTRVNRESKITTGLVEFRGRKATISIDLPKQIEEDVWGAYDKRRATAENHTEPSKHLCDNCGSYCWGDCAAN